MHMFGLVLLYLKSFISFYVGGYSPDLKDAIRLEEGLYHDLKGLFSKRLGLPISKFKAGNCDKLIEQDIREGMAEVIKLLLEFKYEIFYIVRPKPKMILLYRDIYLLQKALTGDLTLDTINIFESLKQSIFLYYQEEVRSYHFKLESLLELLVSSHKVFIEKNAKQIIVSMVITDNRKSFLIPYTDYNDWRRILDNFITNAIEAIELTRKDGKVDIELDYNGKNLAIIRIADNGIGMNNEALSRFTTRGFTWGKPGGQGLGINEDVIAFIKTRGAFAVTSVPGKGTTLAIEIDSSRATKMRFSTGSFNTALGQKTRTLLALIVMTVGTYILLSIPLSELRFWETPQIYGYRLVNPNQDNPERAFYGIRALDLENELIWQKDFKPPSNIINSNQIANFNPSVKDINQDGRNELIIPVRTGTRSQKLASDSLICLGDNKKELWRIGLGLESPRALFDLDKGEEGPAIIKFMGVFNLPKPAIPVLMVCAFCIYYPTQVLLIDGEGKKLKEYWHAGHIDSFDKPWDLDGDGNTEFIFFGINNRLGWSPAIMLIEYDKFRGQSPPYIDTLFSHAEEEAYYIFGHAWIGDSAGFVRTQNDSVQTLNALNTVMIYGVSYKPIVRKSQQEFVYDFVTEDGRTIRFNKQFSLDTIIVDTAEFSRYWDRRKKVSNITRSWNEYDLKQLYGYRKYVNGQLAVDSIFINPEKYNFKDYWAHLLQ
jgi:hypothetical protein